MLDNNNFQDEINFWQQLIDGKHADEKFNQDLKDRINGRNIIADKLKKFVLNKGKSKRILDVGAGPVSILGAYIDNIKLDLTSIDPLANEYNSLLDKANLCPVIKTIYGNGENLKDFVSGKFDFVYSRNALDHSTDPLICIYNMIDVCKIGGTIYIECVINEGLFTSYTGLHKWNLMPVSNDLVVWDKDGNARLLSENLMNKHFKSITCYKNKYSRWFSLIIRKFI